MAQTSVFVVNSAVGGIIPSYLVPIPVPHNAETGMGMEQLETVKGL